MKISRPCSVLRAAPFRPSVLLLGLWLGLLPAAAQAPSQARIEAASYLVEDAARSLAMGYTDSAQASISSALSLYSTSSDAYYLAALVLEAQKAPLASILDCLERSVAHGSFSRYKREQVLLAFASALARTGQSQRALSILSTMADKPDVLYLRTIAYLKAGDLRSAKSIVALATNRYPSDARPAIAYLASASPRFSDRSDRELIDTLMRNLPVLKDSDPSILLYLAPYAASLEQSRYMVREYRAMFGSSALATLLALRFGVISELQAASEPFSGRYVPEQAILIELQSAISSPEAASALTAAFSSYAGHLVLDADRDGVPDAVSSYKAGQLLSWERDANQDGIPELSLAMEESAPVHALVRVDGAVMALRFGPWPFVASVSVSADNGLWASLPAGFLPKADRVEPVSSIRIYTIPYGAFSWPVIQLAPLVGKDAGPYLASFIASSLPSERAIAHAASSVDSRDGSRTEHAQLFQAITQQSWWMDSFGAGGMVLYARGYPSMEFMDLDGDGREESRRLWTISAEGLPIAERLDMDMDGDAVFEFRSRLVEPLLDTWDLDADGLPDLGLQRLADGSQLRSFSAQSDGRLDTSVLMRAGKPVSAQRDGTALAIVPDSGGKVLWLGTKPFDFGASVPPAGMGYRAGVRYVVMSVDGLVLAQALP